MIKSSWQEDADLHKLISELQTDSTSHPAFSYFNGELRRHGKLVIGKMEELKLKILQWLHDSAVGGHSGSDATLYRIKSLFYWPVMNKEVQHYIRNCNTCQRSKSDLAAYPGLIQPLPIPAGVWQSISMDFIEGLPPSFQKHTIMVVVDRLSKNAHFSVPSLYCS